MSVAQQNISTNLTQIHHRIAAAAERVGRSSDEIRLVAVSKTKPFALIQEALAAGQLNFGENRLEELAPKLAEANDVQLDEICWHFIGTIQSRKTAQVVALCGGTTFAKSRLVHSVDRMKILTRLNRDAQAANCVLSVLLEVNVSGEASKHGFTPTELPDLIPEIQALDNIEVQGLMTMAPFAAEAEETRPIFRGLRELRDQVQTAHPEVQWPHLSMGMTNDFEVAIEEGATIVRIGSAIFGKRDYT